MHMTRQTRENAAPPRDAGEERESRFPATRWTLVLSAQGAPLENKRIEALDELLSIYRPALCAHATYRLGIPSDHAEDIVQGFLLEKVLRQNLLTEADRSKGRLRCFLLKIFSNYVRDRVRHENAQKRKARDSAVLHVEDNPDVLSCESEIDKEYNLAWARQIISEAMEKMKKECNAKKRNDLWEVLSCRVLDPSMGQEPSLGYDDLVERFGYKSPTQAFNALVTAKRMFRRALEAAVRDTVVSDDLVAGEIRELRQILSLCAAGSGMQARSNLKE